jgi:hypothetical protein
VPVAAIPTDWEDGLAAAAAQVAGFLTVRPDLLLQEPDSAPCRGWASPRSWTAAVRLLAVTAAAGFGSAVVLTLLTGVLGEGAATELLLWLESRDLPDPMAVLADPSSHPLPSRADALAATLGAITAVVGQRPEHWDAAIEVVRRVAATAPDQAARCLKELVAVAPDGVGPPRGVGILAPVLEAAGMIPKVAA